ncbi:uncharacterized protein TNCV_1355121 [Trichonephila clavipes]|uniref:Uncharacterized protein n=1 Tax=Trichonephila clavipes TaxID=2585209 RepID=A0A8X6S7T1_TRICX|nr:uncharacterized protein TNCV_1355121 [Trichonephila clavipes]
MLNLCVFVVQSLSVPSFLYVSDSPLVSMKKKERKKYRCGQRTTGLEIGDPCSFSFNCLSGCCLKEKNGKTRCRRKTRKDERCSVGQIKLDMYMDSCPCEQGNKFCSDDPEARCLG